MKITGAELFVKALRAEGVDTLFGYPGGQAMDLFDALYGAEDICVILPRHEQGLIHAADGYARSTGKAGICLVTSGPGAANLVTGIATAHYDSVPLVCFTGQVPTVIEFLIEREANVMLKDIERGNFDGIGKPEPLKGDFRGFWSRRIDDVNRLVYRIHGNVMEIVSCKGHYED